jgi:DNA-binding NarL/FixJ family response regulator
MPNKPRIIVADDHRILRNTVAQLLSTDFEVVETVADGRDLLEAVVRAEPEVVVVDIGMPYIDGIEATRLIHQEHPAVCIVVLTAHTDPDFMRACLEAGALGYVVKSRISDLPRAMRAALDGQQFVSPMFNAQWSNNLSNHRNASRKG